MTKGPGMIHYTCDRCKRVLDSADDLRYIVKMEIQAALDPIETCDPDDDRDHLLEIEDILERMEDPDSDLLGEDIYQRKCFDLCTDCHRKFVKNPVGCEMTLQLGFSNN